MTKDEALKLALEALEPFITPNWAGTGVDKANEAYAAIREALEQPAQQETVAWRNAALRVGEDLCSVGPFCYYDMSAEQWLDWALSVVTVHAPPASKPLTDEQITAGARALCKQMAEACGVDVRDQWQLYSDTFKEDAKAVLEAAHAKGDA